MCIRDRYELIMAFLRQEEVSIEQICIFKIDEFIELYKNDGYRGFLIDFLTKDLEKMSLEPVSDWMSQIELCLFITISNLFQNDKFLSGDIDYSETLDIFKYLFDDEYDSCKIVLNHVKKSCELKNNYTFFFKMLEIALFNRDYYEQKVEYLRELIANMKLNEGLGKEQKLEVFKKIIDLGMKIIPKITDHRHFDSLYNIFMEEICGIVNPQEEPLKGIMTDFNDETLSLLHHIVEQTPSNVAGPTVEIEASNLAILEYVFSSYTSHFDMMRTIAAYHLVKYYLSKNKYVDINLIKLLENFHQEESLFKEKINIKVEEYSNDERLLKYCRNLKEKSQWLITYPQLGKIDSKAVSFIMTQVKSEAAMLPVAPEVSEVASDSESVCDFKSSKALQYHIANCIKIKDNLVAIDGGVSFCILLSSNVLSFMLILGDTSESDLLDRKIQMLSSLLDQLSSYTYKESIYGIFREEDEVTAKFKIKKSGSGDIVEQESPALTKILRDITTHLKMVIEDKNDKSLLAKWNATLGIETEKQNVSSSSQN